MADTLPMKTPAEEALRRSFIAASADLPGDAAVRALRARAFESFDAAGLPSRRVEEWKYTDLRALLREAKPLAPPPDGNDIALASAAGAAFDAVHVHRVAIVNGTFVPDLSDFSTLEDGLTIVPLAQALAEGHPLAGRLGKLAPAGDAAVDLNTAFMGDGVVVHVAPGAKIERPVLIANIHVGPATASFTRCLVVVEGGASLTLAKSYEGPDGVDYQTNTAIELHVGKHASLDVVRLQQEGDAALHITTTMAHASTHATISTFSLNIGAAVSRHQVFATLEGDHILSMLRGATLLRRRQHADTTLFVDHIGPAGESREQFKTVLDEEARGVFQGKIIVRADAQKTDGKMSSNALLLGDGVEMANKPELEIYADDVVCGHGATSGALDEDLLFYLRARGIPPAEAEALLIQSFVGEVIDEVEDEALREVLAAAAQRWLARRRRA